MTQEWYFLDLELTLAKLSVQLVLSKLLKYNSKVFSMFFHTLRIYKNVISEHHTKLVQLQQEDGVDEIHEVCQHIRQSK
jgi:hypothetical protein